MTCGVIELTFDSRDSGKRHCERSEAIHSDIKKEDGLLRLARNDGRSTN
jgi:hypothetical protein